MTNNTQTSIIFFSMFVPVMAILWLNNNMVLGWYENGYELFLWDRNLDTMITNCCCILVPVVFFLVLFGLSIKEKK